MEVAALLDRRERVAMTDTRKSDQRRAASPRGADPLADQPLAPDQAHRARRGLQRPGVLRLYLPSRGPAPGQRAWRTGWSRAASRRRPSSPRSCGWEAGSAATTTAIPSSPADVMRGTLRLQSSRVMQFYLNELHVLGSEPSIAAHLAGASEEGCARSRSVPRILRPHRSGEPYRLAVSGIYARLTATAEKLQVEITATAGRQGARPMKASRSCRPISTCCTAR